MNTKILVLQPPSPPYMSVMRDIVGGYGAAFPSKRQEYGHDDWVRPEINMVLFYSAAVVEQKNKDVHLIDGQVEQLNLDKLVSRVSEVNPDIVISIISLPSVYGDLKVLETLKQNFPHIKTIGIGTVCKSLPELILESGVVDIAVQGAPEYVLPELIDVIKQNQTKEQVPGIAFKENGRVVKTSTIPSVVEDLDALPYPAYHLASMDKYWHHEFGKHTRYITILSSKGCPHCCYYCPYPYGFGDKFVLRDPIKVVDEIQYLHDKYGVEALVFRDQVFTANTKRTIELCDELIRRRLRMKWLCETRLDTVNEELLKKMKRAGCMRINYGIESGDPNLFSSGAKAHAKQSLGEFLAKVQLTEKVGIFAHVFILLGLYGENWNTIHNTMEMVKRLKSTSIGVTIATPYPGTSFYNEAKEKGMILTDDWSKYTSYDPVIRTEELSAEDLLRARDMMHEIHRRAVRYKRMGQIIMLNLRKIQDGTIWKQIWRKFTGVR